MARVTIPVVNLGNLGGPIAASLVAADAVNDHEFTNDSRTFLVLENSTASPASVTIVSTGDQWGRVGDVTLTAPPIVSTAAGVAVAGPFDPENFNPGGGSLMNVDVASATGLRLFAFKYSL